ncbi:MAG: ATP-binding protein [Haloarculaceae archaeon]
MKLRTKFAIALLLVMIVLSVVVLGSVGLFMQRTVTEERRNTRETANLTARQIDAVVQTRENELREFSQNQVSDFDDSETYLPLLVDRTRFFAGQAIAPNGTIVDFRGKLNEAARRKAIGKNVSDRPYVRQALQGRVTTSEPEVIETPGGNVSQRFLVKVATPVGLARTLDTNRTVDGVLVGAIYVNFGQYFTPTRTLKTSAQSVAVYDVINGTRVALLPPEKTFEENVTGLATVPSTGWDVVVKRDRATLNARLMDLALGQGVGLLLMLGAVVALGVWEYRTNLSQTERLLAGFTELQAGNFAYDLSLAAAEEWEKISAGFNEMSTGLKRREEAIREREQRLGVLNRVLRHNLQNDMGVIINYAEMIPEFDEAAQEEMAVDKIVSMGRGLLEHGRKARKIEDAMESAEEGVVTIDVAPLVRDAVDSLAEEYPDVTVRTAIPESLPARAIGSLDYAIDNVVENAFEHNDSPEPTVEVVATTDGDAITISVLDDGPGIPEYEQEIFGDQEETDLEHGSGIGLWLAYWVVEKSGGRLDFGDRPDGGAVVSIVLDAPGKDGPDVDGAATEDAAA